MYRSSQTAVAKHAELLEQLAHERRLDARASARSAPPTDRPRPRSRPSARCRRHPTSSSRITKSRNASTVEAPTPRDSPAIPPPTITIGTRISGPRAPHPVSVPSRSRCPTAPPSSTKPPAIARGDLALQPDERRREQRRPDERRGQHPQELAAASRRLPVDLVELFAVVAHEHLVVQMVRARRDRRHVARKVEALAAPPPPSGIAARPAASVGGV